MCLLLLFVYMLVGIEIFFSVGEKKYIKIIENMYHVNHVPTCYLRKYVIYHSKMVILVCIQEAKHVGTMCNVRWFVPRIHNMLVQNFVQVGTNRQELKYLPYVPTKQ
uniref:Secreted protein n=1 Tax=Cacopsylla melanoneura TaxID=428564 RepID=A0A8D8RW77_9HEMI